MENTQNYSFKEIARKFPEVRRSNYPMVFTIVGTNDVIVCNQLFEVVNRISEDDFQKTMSKNGFRVVRNPYNGLFKGEKVRYVLDYLYTGA